MAGDRFDSLRLGGAFQSQMGHEGGGGVEVDDPAGVDQEQPVAIGVDAQVDAGALARGFAEVVKEA